MAYPFESSIQLTNAACQLVFASSTSYIEESSAGQIDIYANSVNVMTLTSSGMALTSGSFVDTIETTITDDDTHIPTSGAVVDYCASFGDVSWGTASNNYLVFGSASGDIQSDSGFSLNTGTHALNIDGGASDGGEVHLWYNGVNTWGAYASSATASVQTWHTSFLLRSFQDGAYMGIGDTSDSGTFVTISDPATTGKTSILRIRNQGLTLEWDFREDGSWYVTGLGSDDTEDHVLAIDDTTGLITKRAVSSIGGSSNVSVANQGDNRIVTATGTTDALNAEANFTFDGTNVLIAGAGQLRFRDTANYIDSNALNELEIVVNSAVAIAIDSNSVDIGLNLEMLSGNIIYLDGTAGDSRIWDATGDLTFRDASNTGGVTLSTLVAGVNYWTDGGGYLIPNDSGDSVRLDGTTGTGFLVTTAYTTGMTAAGTTGSELRLHANNVNIMQGFSGWVQWNVPLSISHATPYLQFNNDAEVRTSDSATSPTADITVTTGDATDAAGDNSGNIHIYTGASTAGTRGSIYFGDGATNLGLTNDESETNVVAVDTTTGLLTYRSVSSLGGSSPWTTDTNGITYTGGNVGINQASSASYRLGLTGTMYVIAGSTPFIMEETGTSYMRFVHDSSTFRLDFSTSGGSAFTTYNTAIAATSSVVNLYNAGSLRAYTTSGGFTVSGDLVSDNTCNMQVTTHPSTDWTGGAGWYQIAETNGGDHAAAWITINDYHSGDHGYAKFMVTFHHGQGTVTQVAGDTYSGAVVTDVRLVYNDADRVYNGGRFEIYVSDTTANVNVQIEDWNVSSTYSEWILIDPPEQETGWTAFATLENTHTTGLATTSNLRVNNQILVATSSSSFQMDITHTGGGTDGVQFRASSSSGAGGLLRLRNTNTSQAIGAEAGRIEFFKDDASTQGAGHVGRIWSEAIDAGGSYSLKFSTGQDVDTPAGTNGEFELTYQGYAYVYGATTALFDVVSGATGTASLRVSSATGYDAYMYWREGGTVRYIMGYDDSGDIFQINAGSTFSTTADFQIDSGGFVGLGIDPTAQLHVSGAGDTLLILADNSSTGNPRLAFNQTTTRRSYIQHVDSGDVLKLAAEYGDMDFYTGTSGSEVFRMRISDTGDVGIGATTAVTAGYRLELFSTDNKGRAADWTATSDINLKTNIKPYGSVLCGIMDLHRSEHGLSLYNRRILNEKGRPTEEHYNELEVGYIAQDMLQIFPTVVNGSEEEFYDISYMRLGAIALSGVAELKNEKDREIDALNKRVKILEDKLKKYGNNNN